MAGDINSLNLLVASRCFLSVYCSIASCVVLGRKPIFFAIFARRVKVLDQKKFLTKQSLPEFMIQIS